MGRSSTAARRWPRAITIANSGDQIPPELVPRLFEPFRRMHDRTHSDNGLGLGLSTARAVAESHGGTLQATPRAGGGLEVRTRLPGAARNSSSIESDSRSSSPPGPIR